MLTFPCGMLARYVVLESIGYVVRYRSTLHLNSSPKFRDIKVPTGRSLQLKSTTIDCSHNLQPQVVNTGCSRNFPPLATKTTKAATRLAGPQNFKQGYTAYAQRPNTATSLGFDFGG